MKRILLTGGTGFIGRQTIPFLKAKGYEIYATTSKDTAINDNDVQWLHGNLMNEEFVSSIITKIRPTHLLHLAWITTPDIYWNSPVNFDWTQASIYMIQRFIEKDGKRIVSAGSCAEYDWSGGICVEYATPLKSLSAYSEAAIPEWGRERPSTLVWLAVGDAHGRRLTGLGDILGYVEKMEARSKKRGIVLVHPLLDLQDTSQLRASDIWGGFQEPVVAASGRYKANVVLTGRVESVLPELWEAHWKAYINEQVFTWITQGTELGTVLDEGIDALADALSEQYGQAGTYTQSEKIEILVNDIADFNQYSKVLNYLESLNSVINVEVKGVNLDSVVFLLITQADTSVISKAVGLGHVLEQTSATSYRLVQ